MDCIRAAVFGGISEKRLRRPSILLDLEGEPWAFAVLNEPSSKYCESASRLDLALRTMLNNGCF